jgi:hypothetical protein
METILLQPADEAELERLKAFLNETHIKSRILSEEDKEDFALGLMMQETDYNDVVGTDEFIYQFLN